MSKNTNYCSEYLASGLRPVGDEHYDFIVNNNIEGIFRGTRFRLPDNGVVLEVLPITGISQDSIKIGFSKYIEHVKLPYQDIVLEYLQVGMADDGREVRIKTLVFVTESNRGGIVLNTAFSSITLDAGRWFIHESVLFIESDLTLKATSLKNKMGKLSEEEESIMLNAANVVLSFLAALQCSNVVQTDQPAPKFINERRAKKNKLPLFSYKVLTIDTKNKAEAQKGGAGTGNTKRVHLRRGHIRRLADRTIWVNPCVVGDKSKGMITKDYRVI